MISLFRTFLIRPLFNWAVYGQRVHFTRPTFIAAKIAEDILIRCMPGKMKPGNIHTKGTIVIGNIEDDFHSLGRKIVSSFLRAMGWEIYDLGNDVPAEDFINKAVEVGAFAIGISAMMQTTARNILKVRRLIDERGLKGRLMLAVGGAVFNFRPGLVQEVGGDGTTQNASGADALFEHLQEKATNDKIHEFIRKGNEHH